MQTHLATEVAVRSGSACSYMVTMLMVMMGIIGQGNRLAMWCCLCRAVPGVTTIAHGLDTADALQHDQRFQRCQPMLIIGVAEIGIAGCLRRLDCRRQGRCPFR